MYKGIATIDKSKIESLKITAEEKYLWVDTALRNKSTYILPTKIRMPLKNTDYFNVMPCALPSEGVLGLKVVTRNEIRRENGETNIDGDILLYSYEDFKPLALMDGAYITTIRTAAVAVHSMLNFAPNRNVIAMVGLGNIGIEIGNILFELRKQDCFTVKLYRYKNHAEKFIEKFKQYKNITFQICDSYEELMFGSDVIFSSVTYIDEDFCKPEIYKAGCTVIPVHLRGFKECDKVFDTIITSDVESIKKFEYYNQMRDLQLIDNYSITPPPHQHLDVEAIKDESCNQQNQFIERREYLSSSSKRIQSCDEFKKSKLDKRILIYNLGLAIYDLFFAAKINEKLSSNKF